MIHLFTDFGSSDIYVGQVKAELARLAPTVGVVDLFNDAPAFQVRASAHLLAALAGRLHPGDVILAVVDPGVGTERRPVVVRADGRHFVGPDNGLLSIVAARASDVQVSEIVWRPRALSISFHGRDLFAPIAAGIAGASLTEDALRQTGGLEARIAPASPEIVYVDHYGNGFASLLARDVPKSARLAIAGREIAHADVFAVARAGEPFWYANSLGLVEVACNRASAAASLKFAIGDAVAVLQ